MRDATVRETAVWELVESATAIGHLQTDLSNTRRTPRLCPRRLSPKTRSD